MTVIKKIETAYYHEILCELLLKTVVLTYIFKNVNLSNDSRVSKRDVKSFSSQYVLDGRIQNTCI